MGCLNPHEQEVRRPRNVAEVLALPLSERPQFIKQRLRGTSDDRYIVLSDLILALEPELLSVALNCQRFDVLRVCKGKAPSPGRESTIGREFYDISLCDWAFDVASRCWPVDVTPRVVAVLEMIVDRIPVETFVLARRFRSQRLDGTTVAMTCLEQACVWFNSSAQLDIIRMLVRKGGGGLLKSGNPLKCAVIMSSAEVLKLLLEAGVSAARTHPKGMTALHFLAQQEVADAPEKVRLLVAAGAPLDARDSLERTPLILSLFSRNTLQAYEALKAAGADLRALREHDVLHLLTLKGNEPALRRILDPALTPPGIFDVNAKDCTPFDRRPLHLAALADHHRVAQLLIDAGADVTARTRDGFTAFDQATKFGSHRTAAVLADAFVLERGTSGLEACIKAVEILLSGNGDIQAKEVPEKLKVVTFEAVKRSEAQTRSGWTKILNMLQARLCAELQ